MESMATAVSGGGGGGMDYQDSVDSSPHSRGGESWNESIPSFAAETRASRLRLMCSYGGRIVPRPTDKSLCYLGGETRIVVVDRQYSLADLTAKLSCSLLGGRPFSLKYQLPNEDLDSLVSVTTDEDLVNMIEEYDRLLASAAAAAAAGDVVGSVEVGGGSIRSSRLRLFLFLAKSESTPPSTTGSLLNDSKSETWFVDALNSTIGGVGIDGLHHGLSADAASVNCALDLQNDASVHSRGGAALTVAGVGLPEPVQLVLPRPDSSVKLARHGQDVQSIPDSPILDNTSSFGSSSSVPSLSNLLPIRDFPDQRPPDHRISGLDYHFAHLDLSSAATVAAAGPRVDESFEEQAYAPQHQAPPPIHLPTASASTSIISPSENSSRVFSSDDEKSNHGGIRKPLQPPKPTQIDAPIPDSGSRPVYMNANYDQKLEFPVSSDPGYRVPMPFADAAAGYVLPSIHPEQLQPQQPHPQIQQQQQQQYNPASPPYYIHHADTGAVMPVPSYYHPIAAHPILQSQQAHRYDTQVSTMYYLPVRQTTQYELAAMQPAALADPHSIQSAGKPTMQVARVTAKPELPTSLYSNAVPTPSPVLQSPLIHVAADQAHPYAGTGYHVVHHQHLSQSPATMANYGYEFTADPMYPHVYYSHATSPPALPHPYQIASFGAVTADATPPGEAQADTS